MLEKVDLQLVLLTVQYGILRTLRLDLVSEIFQAGSNASKLQHFRDAQEEVNCFLF